MKQLNRLKIRISFHRNSFDYPLRGFAKEWRLAKQTTTEIYKTPAIRQKVSDTLLVYHINKINSLLMVFIVHYKSK